MADDAVSLGVEMLPVDEPVAPDDAVAAASAAALDAPLPQQIAAGPEPFGLSWDFDYSVGRFRQQGASPAETHGFGSLAQWCLMTIHTARYAYPVFGDTFGWDEPEEPLGRTDVAELSGDWAQRLREALLVHDRVSSVDIATDWDPVNGVLTVTKLDVVTDEAETLSLDGVQLQPITME